MIRLFHFDIPWIAPVLLGLDLLCLDGIRHLGRWLVEPNGITGLEKSLERSTAVLIGLSLILAFAMGLYQRRFLRTPANITHRCIVSLGLASMLFCVLSFIFPALSMSFTSLLAIAPVAVVGLAAERILLLRIVNLDSLARRVLVIGTGADARFVEALQQRSGSFVCAGFMMVGSASTEVDSERVLRCPRIADAVSASRANEIIVAVPSQERPDIATALLEMRLSGLRVLSVQSFIERETRRIEPQAIDPMWLAMADGVHVGRFGRILKRALDLFGAVSLIAMTAPLQAIAAAAIWIDDGRPVLYRQQRVGRGGQPFEIFKFRSMRVDAEKDGIAVWAAVKDRRVTRIGGFLRKTRIDELPQLINVIRGEMSFVGPRPERPAMVQTLAHEIPYYNCRHSVKPGVTGWAQVNFPYGASIEDAREKFAYDLYYVKNGGLVLDVIIVLQTLRVILWSEGAR